METIFIVNLSETAFFRYDKENECDKGYNRKLLDLLTPPSNSNTNVSHWNRGDKIVLAPKHLHGYLERIYNEIHI